MLWLSAAWAAANTAAHMPLLGLGLIAIDVAVLGYSAQRFAGGSHEQDGTAMTLLFAMPLLAASWNIGFHPLVDDSAGFRLLCVTTLAGLAMALFAQRLAWLDQRWSRQALPAIFWFDAYLLGALTLCYIARGAWPVAYEWSGLALLALLCWLQRDAPGAERRAVATLVAGALVVQAQLLRVLTPELQPDRVMSVLDVTAMTLPAVLSLIWALLGAALAYWSGRSRPARRLDCRHRAHGGGGRQTGAGRFWFARRSWQHPRLDCRRRGIHGGGVGSADAAARGARGASPPSRPTPAIAPGGEAPSGDLARLAQPEAPAPPPAAAPLEFGTFNLRPRVTRCRRRAIPWAKARAIRPYLTEGGTLDAARLAMRRHARPADAHYVVHGEFQGAGAHTGAATQKALREQGAVHHHFDVGPQRKRPETSHFKTKFGLDPRGRQQAQRAAITGQQRTQLFVIDLRIMGDRRQHDARPGFDFEGDGLGEIGDQVRCELRALRRWCAPRRVRARSA